MKSYRVKRNGAVVPTEHAEQRALMQWAEIEAGRHPELALLFAIPNGGHRIPAVAVRLKAEGVKAGVPDLFLPVARQECHGLWIEMKAKDGRVSPKQGEWMERLEEQGYRVAVAFSAEEAMQILKDYLKGQK